MTNKLIIILGIILLSLTSCSKEEEEVIKTKIQVSVLKDNNPLKDATVYLFSASTQEPKIVNAKASAVTSNNGIVTFTLEDVQGITVTDTAQTFNVIVFEPYSNATTSIKKGETKAVQISISTPLGV